MVFGNRIKTVREALSLTQEEFASKIGISRGALSKLESEQNNPSTRTLKLICREFGVASRYLFQGQEPMFAPKEKSVRDKIDRLLNGDNAFVKSVFIELADLSEQEWEVLYGFVKRVLEKTEEKSPGV